MKKPARIWIDYGDGTRVECERVRDPAVFLWLKIAALSIFCGLAMSLVVGWLVG